MPLRILMVCLGNICRSPLAEGIMKTLSDPSRVEVDSAGTAGYHIGKPPDPRSIEVASAHQIDIGGQRCRKFSVADFDAFDHIFAMDLENLEAIRRLARNEADARKVRLLLEAGGLGPSEVPDPYYGGASGFLQVFQMLETACRRIAAELQTA